MIAFLKLCFLTRLCKINLNFKPSFSTQYGQMKALYLLGIFILPGFFLFPPKPTQPESAAGGWTELINGKDFTGWKVSTENKETWTLTPEGYFQAFGKRAHLFYEGELLGQGFKNFEIEAQVRTFQLANSGIFFHTKYQESGWPGGFEIQVNNSHMGEGDFKELKRMGSLYGIRNVYKTVAKDDEWIKVKARVESDRVQIWVNGIKTADYIQPERKVGNTRRLSSGTFALQGHDVKSKMQYRSFKVRRLPDDARSNLSAITYATWQDSLLKYQNQQFGFIDLNSRARLSANDFAKYSYSTGINAAVVVNPKDAKLLNAAKGLPLFTGIRVNAQNLQDLKTTTADYVLGESTGLESAETLLKSQKINIWADKGKSLSGNQVDALLDLAVQNKVAIEIDNEDRHPSIEVLLKAKAKGCKFTFTGLIPADKLNQSLYAIEAIRGAKLNYKDLYVPKW